MTKKILSTQRFQEIDSHYHNTVVPELTKVPQGQTELITDAERAA